MGAPRTVNCPRCSTPVVWDSAARFRPFCSERCKMGDLGSWATEQYRVSESSDPIAEETAPEEPPR
jgi:endogenous inhibitor of DNA gyrase (YacG/DUF329 family)